MTSVINSLGAYARSPVLVVDDILANVELVDATLRRAGLRSVVTETSALRALDRIEHERWHLVVLDLHMPEVDGFAVLEMIRARWGALDLPVLVLTADATRTAIHRAFAGGANDFVTKPVDLTEVVLRARNLLQARELYEQSLQQRSWMEASAALAHALLADDVAQPLQVVAELARTVADADFAVVTIETLPDPAGDGASTETGPAAVDASENGTLSGSGHPHTVPGFDATPRPGRFWHTVDDDTDAQTRQAVVASIDSTVAAAAILDGTPQLIDDHATTYPAAAAGGRPLGPVLVVPLVGQRSARGALSLVRVPGRESFGVTALHAVTAFAHQVAVVLELADTRRERQRVSQLEDRNRIARDLHDHVIQRLFAVGLRMQSLAALPRYDAMQEPVATWTADLDETIQQIRSSIYLLRDSRLGPSESVGGRLQAVVGDLSDVLDFTPRLHFAGPIDAVVSPDLADDVTAVIREALSNIARHAAATEAAVEIQVDGTVLTVTVRDNGVGIGTPDRNSGLGNLAARAERNGGRFVIEAVSGGGTQLSWTAELGPACF